MNDNTIGHLILNRVCEWFRRTCLIQLICIVYYVLGVAWNESAVNQIKFFPLMDCTFHPFFKKKNCNSHIIMLTLCKNLLFELWYNSKCIKMYQPKVVVQWPWEGNNCFVLQNSAVGMNLVQGAHGDRWLAWLVNGCSEAIFIKCT